MLIFISDLHFVDGTAGEHNVPTDAFRIFLGDISATCEWLKEDGTNINEIKLVFLGDTFDLLRTELWFQFAEDERPWGNQEPQIEKNANTIFDAIINNKRNQETFNLLKGDLKEQFGLPVEPERIYIPGNHDRLCNKYKSLRDKVHRWLNIKTGDPEPFNHYFQDVDYGVFARHGHEFDKFNYEGAVSYGYENYMRVPIGDPITTELVAKLPWKIMQRKEIKSLSEDEQNSLRRNFQEIENVRPFSATVEWLLYQVKKDIRLKDAIEEAVDEAIAEFNKLDFVKKWYSHHDKWFDFLNEADKIQSVLFLLEKFRIFPLEKIMPLLQKVKDRFAKDDLLEAAPKEFSNLDNRIRYVVYGHTHEPLQIPIGVIGKPNGGTREHHYLNTGTWRERYRKTYDGLGFIGWKNLTYTVFYKKEERETKDKKQEYPTFETWTGALNTV